MAQQEPASSSSPSNSNSASTSTSKADLLFLDPSKHSNDSPFLVNNNNTNNNTTSPSKPPTKPKFEKLPPSSVLSRAKDFLPLLANANKKLEEDIKNNADVNIEKVDESKPYISMKLALGVLEEQKGVTEDNITIPSSNNGADGRKPVIEILAEDSDVNDSGSDNNYEGEDEEGEEEDDEGEDDAEDDDVDMAST